MNKRLRRKKHKGEFKELMFSIKFTAKVARDSHAIMDTFTDLVESLGTINCGWTNGVPDGEHGYSIELGLASNATEHVIIMTTLLTYVQLVAIPDTIMTTGVLDTYYCTDEQMETYYKI